MQFFAIFYQAAVSALVVVSSSLTASRPKMETYQFSKTKAVALSALELAYMGLNSASYLPLARQGSGAIRVALTIVIGSAFLARCKKRDRNEVLMMMVAQLVRGVFEMLVALPLFLTAGKLSYVFLFCSVNLEIGVSVLNIRSIISQIKKPIKVYI